MRAVLIQCTYIRMGHPNARWTKKLKFRQSKHAFSSVYMETQDCMMRHMIYRCMCMKYVRAQDCVHETCTCATLHMHKICTCATLHVHETSTCATLDAHEAACKNSFSGCERYSRVGQNLYKVYIDGNFCRKFIKYTVIYGVIIRLWPTLHTSEQ